MNKVKQVEKKGGGGERGGRGGVSAKDGLYIKQTCKRKIQWEHRRRQQCTYTDHVYRFAQMAAGKVLATLHNPDKGCRQ